jgi:hypothetical protein
MPKKVNSELKARALRMVAERQQDCAPQTTVAHLFGSENALSSTYAHQGGGPPVRIELSGDSGQVGEDGSSC